MFGTAMSVHNIFSILSFFALGVLWYTIQAISVIGNARLLYSKASLIAQCFLFFLNCFSQNIFTYFCDDMLQRDTASKTKDRELGRRQ